MSTLRRRLLRVILLALDGCSAVAVVLALAAEENVSGEALLLSAVLLVFLSSTMGLEEPLSSPKKSTLMTAIFFVSIAWSTCGVVGGIFPIRLPITLFKSIFLLLTMMTLTRFCLAIVMQQRCSRIVVVGVGPRANRIRLALERQAFGDKRFVGFMAAKGQRRVAGYPCYRSEAELPKNCRVLSLQGRPHGLSGPSPLFGMDHQPWTSGSWTLRPAEGPADGVSGRLKRTMDLLIALVVLVPLLVIITIVVLFMLLTRHGSPIYRQIRVTLGGKEFAIYKIRTMPVGAEPKNVPIWPTTADSRITPIGKLLRNLWLDELPQLWNVLRGDLSWIGPRPERPEFAQVFSKSLPKYTLRHRARAGVTGLAQMRGFVGNTSLRKRLSSDLQYIRDWSPWLDVKVLLGTVCQAFVRRQQPIFDFMPGDGGRIP